MFNPTKPAGYLSPIMKHLPGALLLLPALGRVVPDPVRMRCYGLSLSDIGCTRNVFTVAVSQDGDTPAFALHAPGESVTVSIAINGVAHSPLALLDSRDPESTAFTLELRSGINVVELSSSRDLIELRIPGATPPPPIGAAVDFAELEAENATYSGTLIGPSFEFTTLPSEASARMAVQLSTAGQYVEFTLPSPANAFAVRYSIPNSPDGHGWDGA